MGFPASWYNSVSIPWADSSAMTVFSSNAVFPSLRALPLIASTFMTTSLSVVHRFQAPASGFAAQIAGHGQVLHCTGPFTTGIIGGPSSGVSVGIVRIDLNRRGVIEIGRAHV